MTEEQKKAQREYQRRIFEEIQRRQQVALAARMAAQRNAELRQQAIDEEPRQQYAVIAAVDSDRGFSKAGEIPWHYKEDFTWFKKITTGHICVMGRTTYEDINKRLGEKAKQSVLPNRQCFVVSSTLKQENVLNATVVQNIYDVVCQLEEEDYNKTIFFIGGGRIFTEGISLADTVYLTVINKTHGCDKFFPVEYVNKYFILNKTHKTESAPDLRFLTFTRGV